jgi:hypothetical protein
MPCRRPGGFWSRKRLRLAVRSSLDVPIAPTAASSANGSTRPFCRPSWSRRRMGRADQGTVIDASLLVMLTTGSRQFVEQHLCVLQIDGVEALGEPAVNGRQQLARGRATTPYPGAS